MSVHELFNKKSDECFKFFAMKKNVSTLQGRNLRGVCMGGVTPPPKKNTNYLDWQAIKDCK